MPASLRSLPLPRRVFGVLAGAVFAAGAATAAPVNASLQNQGGKPLGDAVLTLHAASGRTPTPAPSKAEIEQVGKSFRPYLTVIPVGSAVQFPNRDSVRHHVYSFSPAKTFELKLYAGTPATPVVFDKPGAVALGCNIHDQMTAWVFVTDTPWHARSGEDGKALTDVPPGNYVARVWHPDLPPSAKPVEQAVTVGAGGATLTLKLPVAGTGKHLH